MAFSRNAFPLPVTHCRQTYTATPEERSLLGIATTAPCQLYRASAYAACNDSGCRGRMGIYELIRVDKALRTLIHQGGNESELRAYTRVRAGQTSLDEVLRVTREI